MVKIYYQTSRCVRQTYRALRQVYGAHNRQSENLERNSMDRFRTRLDNTHPNRSHAVSVTEDFSIRHRSQQVDLCPFTKRKILTKDLGLHPNEIQLVKFNTADHQVGRVFGE